MPAPIIDCYRTLLNAALLGGLFLCLSSSVFASESHRFQTGKAAFERGDYPSAYKTFHALLKQQPGDPELDFYLGRSAFQIGDYETAIFAFERVLIVQQHADRVKLELGRSYYEIGALQAARSSFMQVLANNPPATVKANVERYLLLLERALQQHKLSGFVSQGINYDSNVYFTPVEDVIRFDGGFYTLAAANAKQQQDVISQTSFKLDHRYQQHPKSLAWRSSAQIYTAVYAREKSLNLNLFSLSSGPIWQQGKHRTELRGRYDLLTLDEERYLTISSASLEHSWVLSPLLTAAATAELAYLNYQVAARDARRYRVELTPLISWQRSRLLATLGLEQNDARDDQYSYLRKLLAVRYEQQLPWKLTASLGGRLQASAYKGVTALFGKKRSDRFRELALGFSRPIWQQPGGSGQLQAQLNAVLSETSANIDLYRYDKQVVNFTLSYLF